MEDSESPPPNTYLYASLCDKKMEFGLKIFNEKTINHIIVALTLGVFINTIAIYKLGNVMFPEFKKYVYSSLELLDAKVNKITDSLLVSKDAQQ